jgi:hypothetical protein
METSYGKYAWLRDGGVEPIDWEAASDEWLHHLSERLTQDPRRIRVSQTLFDMTTQPFIEIAAVSADGGPIDTRLLLVPTKAGLLTFFGGREAEVDESDCDAWAEAAKAATRDLGSGEQQFEWTAIIGSPVERMGGTESALSGPAVIGPFTLSAMAHPLREAWSQPGNPSLGSWSTGSSWPILVSGHNRGYDWNKAGRAAAFDLELLCALLTVASDHDCFVVREGLAPLDWGTRTAPETLPWQCLPAEPEKQEDRSTAWSLPTWTAQAWEHLVAHPWLAAAVTSYHEGAQAALKHPSLALVAYIAAIEAVSSRLLVASRCTECGSTKHIRARFQAALRLVRDDATAAFIGNAYRPRSKTVHQGILHGGELRRGHVAHTWGRDPIRDFEWGTVYQMGRAAHDLLARALQDRLPDRADFDPDQDAWREVDRDHPPVT